MLTPAAMPPNQSLEISGDDGDLLELRLSSTDNLTVGCERQVLVPIADRHQDREVSGPEGVDRRAFRRPGSDRQALVPERIPGKRLIADANATGIVLRREKPHLVVGTGKYGERTRPHYELVTTADQWLRNWGRGRSSRFFANPNLRATARAVASR